MSLRLEDRGRAALVLAAGWLLLPGIGFAVPSLGSNCSSCHGNPTLVSNPASGGILSFGTGGRTLVGQSSTATWTLSNTTVNAPNNGGGFSGSFPGAPAGSEFSPSTALAITGSNSNAPGFVTPGTSESRTYTYAPTGRGTDTATLSFTPTGGFSAGAAPTVTVTLQGQGVAPVISLDTSHADAGAVRIGTTGSAQVGVGNTGDGNQSGLGDVSNLHGSVGAGSGSFSGSGGTFNLADGATQSFSYTFAPTTRGTANANIAVAATNGSSDGGNHSQSSSTTLTGRGVGPVYHGSTAPGGTLSFAGGVLSNVLSLSNTTSDGNLGALTTLTLLSAQISGTDASLFSLHGFTSGMQLAPGGLFDLEVDYTGAAGSHSAVLTVVTDEGAALGANGDAFTYTLSATAVVTAVPEPGSAYLMVAGLAGLVSLLRQRRKRVS